MISERLAVAIEERRRALPDPSPARNMRALADLRAAAEEEGLSEPEFRAALATAMRLAMEDAGATRSRPLLDLLADIMEADADGSR
jgi:hypothetical protein